MPDPDRGTKKVSSSAIDEIKKMGMGAAIKQYSSGGGSPEFRTAVERYYSPQRLKEASGSVKPTPSGGGPTMSNASTSKPISMPASVPATASRNISKPFNERNVGTETSNAVKSAAKNTTGGIRSVYRNLTNYNRHHGIKTPPKKPKVNDTAEAQRISKYGL